MSLLQLRGPTFAILDLPLSSAVDTSFTQLVLDWKGDQVTVAEDIVTAAAGNSGSGAKVMGLLLNRKGDQVTVTEHIITATAKNSEIGAEVIAVLLNRKGDQVTVTEDIVKAAAENSWRVNIGEC